MKMVFIMWTIKKNNNTFLSDGWSGDWSVRVEVCSEVT